MEGDVKKRKSLLPVLAVRPEAEPQPEAGPPGIGDSPQNGLPPSEKQPEGSPENAGGVVLGIRSRSKYLSRKKGDNTEEPGRARKRHSYFNKKGDRFTGNELFGFTLLAPGLENADPKGVERLNKAMTEILKIEGEVGDELLREAALPTEDRNENSELPSMTDSFESVIIPVSGKSGAADKTSVTAAGQEERAEERTGTEEERKTAELEASAPAVSDPAGGERNQTSPGPGAASESAAAAPEPAEGTELSEKTDNLPDKENERLSSQLEKVPKAKAKKNKRNRRTGGSRIRSADGRSVQSSESKIVSEENKNGENGKNAAPDFAEDLKDAACGKEAIPPSKPKQELDEIEEDGVGKGGSDMLPRDGEDYEIAGSKRMSSSGPVDREAGTRMVRGSKVMGMTRERAKKLELQFQQGVSGNDIHRARTAVNRRTGVNPPRGGTRTGTRQNPPGFGTRTGMNQNPPGFGSRTGMHQNPPGFGSRTGMNQAPPGFGSRTGMNQAPPGFGSRTGMNQAPPGFGSRTGMNRAPGYGQRTGMNQVPPGYGQRTGMNQVPPGYGQRTGMNQVPPGYGQRTGMNQLPPGYGQRPVLNQTPVFGRSTGLNQYNNSGYGNNRFYQGQGYREQPYPVNNGYGGYGYSNNGYNGGAVTGGYGQYPGGNYDINNGYTGVIPRNMPFRNNPQEGYGGAQNESPDMGAGMGREHLTPAETYAKAVEESQREGGRAAAFISWLKNGGAVLITCLLLITAAICGFVMFVMSRTGAADDELLLPPKRPQLSQPAGRDFNTGRSGSSSIESGKSGKPSVSAPPAKPEAASGAKSSGTSARGNATVVPGSSAKPAAPPKAAPPARQPSVTVKKTETRNSDFENNEFKFDDGDFGDWD